MSNKKHTISPEDENFARTLLVKEAVYEAVIGQLKIDHDDEIYRSLIMGMLKRQTKDHIIFSIWNNLDAKQAVHLRVFAEQMAAVAPELDNDNVLIEFALMYPELKKKVFASLSGFFKNFIAKFNEISEA